MYYYTQPKIIIINREDNNNIYYGMYISKRIFYIKWNKLEKRKNLFNQTLLRRINVETFLIIQSGKTYQTRPGVNFYFY